MDITELIQGAEMTQTGWADKETETQEEFYGATTQKHYSR